MVRISKGQLRLALVIAGILVIACLVTEDYIMAGVFTLVAALGAAWQLRHAEPKSDHSDHRDDDRAKN